MRSKMYCIYIVNEQNKAYTKGIYGNKDRAIERYKKWLNEYRAEPMHIEYLRYELVEYKLSKDQITAIIDVQDALTRFIENDDNLFGGAMSYQIERELTDLNVMIMETLYAYDKIGDKRTLRSTTIKEGEIA
jgi:tetratricopeptide (TPR) repeat protein